MYVTFYNQIAKNYSSNFFPCFQNFMMYQWNLIKIERAEGNTLNQEGWNLCCVKVMLHRTIRDNDFKCNTVLQHCCYIPLNDCNTVPKFEPCVMCQKSSLRIVPCTIIFRES